MAITHGMDPEAVDRLGQHLQRSGAQLERIANEIDRMVRVARWEGPEAARFLQTWPRHRNVLRQSAQGLSGLGQSALNNASEQRQASREGTGGRPAAISTWSSSRFGWSGLGAVGAASIRSSDAFFGRIDRWLDRVEPATTYAKLVDDSPAMGAFGTAAGAVGLVAGASRAGREILDGNYGGASLSVLTTGADAAADKLMLRPTPVSYLAAVNLRMYGDVVSAGRDIDWSPSGLDAIRTASLGDWGRALAETLPQSVPMAISNFIP